MKKYKNGYLAGVFDLYHVGHLNLIRRAKERCDYLMIGLLTDEMVVKLKKNPPYIPFEERKQILESVRYVDQVVAVTEENHEKMKAWNLYHFDCLFSGDDYSQNLLAVSVSAEIPYFFYSYFPLLHISFCRDLLIAALIFVELVLFVYGKNSMLEPTFRRDL